MALISEPERTAFRGDGAATLRNALTAEWIGKLSRAMDAALADPGPNYVKHARTPGAPAYHEEFWCWAGRPEFTDFVCNSHCAPLAGELLGDCVFFDMRTLHGGLASRPQAKTSRRYAQRMTAEDGMIRYRGDWAAGERAMFEARGFGDGDAIAGQMFPQLWPRGAT